MKKLVKHPLDTYEEKRDSTNFDTYRNVLKSLTYLINIFVEEETKTSITQKNYNDLHRVKGQKKKKKTQEITNFASAIDKLNQLLDCQLKYLWVKTRKIEPEFVKCLIDIGFSLLENSKSLKNDPELKDQIFQFLQKVISQYSKELSGAMTQVTARIVSIMYKIDEIADPLADFVVIFTENDPQSNFAGKIIEELLTAIFNSDSSHDNIGIRNCSNFLSKLSKSVPQPLFENLGKLLGLLDCEAYALRIAFTNIITNLIIELLTKQIQETEDIEIRQNFHETKLKLLKILLRRIFDKTSYVRKEVLNNFKYMIVKNVVDSDFYPALLSA